MRKACPCRGIKVGDFLQEGLALPEVRAVRKADVIRELASWLAERHAGVDEEDVARALAEREELGSTAIGDGIAIPHAKLDSAEKLIACLARSRRGIDFGSADGQKTHFFFALVAPESSSGDHLKALARISRLFKGADFRARLMRAETAHEMFEILADEDARNPA